MKKIYNRPAIETAELHLHTAIMSGVGGDNMNNQTGSGNSFGGGGNGAPRKKLF